FEHDGSERVHVRASVDLASDKALRRDVVWRNRSACARARVEGRHGAETESGQQCPAVKGEQDVRGLHIAVNGRARMRVVQRAGYGTQQRDDPKRLITLS